MVKILFTLILFTLPLFGKDLLIKEPKKVTGITKTHNKIRRKLNLPDLQWSPKLAAVAQRWADHLAKNNNCQMKHLCWVWYGYLR